MGDSLSVPELRRVLRRFVETGPEGWLRHRKFRQAIEEAFDLPPVGDDTKRAR